jgi:hypothetical protein
MVPTAFLKKSVHSVSIDASETFDKWIHSKRLTNGSKGSLRLSCHSNDTLTSKESWKYSPKKNPSGLSILSLQIHQLPRSLHMIRDTAFWGENVKTSVDSTIRRLVNVGARVGYHVRKWYVHIASVFPLGEYA